VVAGAAFLKGLSGRRLAVVAALMFLASASAIADPFVEYTVAHFRNAGVVVGLLNSCGDSGKAAAYGTLLGDLARRNAPADAALRQAFKDGMAQGLANAGSVPSDLCQQATELADDFLGGSAAPGASRTVAPAKPAPTPAKVQGPLLLALKGTTGDAFRVDNTARFIFKHIPQADPGSVDTIEIEIGTAVDMRVRELRPNGNIVFDAKPMRLAKYQSLNGATTFAFDSENPALLAAAKNDPQGRQILAALGVEARIEQDSRGALIDYKVDASSGDIEKNVDKVLGDAVSQDYVMLPPKPLAIGERWEIGARDFRFPGVGSLRYTLTGKFVATGASRGERVAWIELAGANPVFSAMGQAADTLKVKTFSMKGQAFFALDKGRIVYESIDFKMGAQVREADGKVNGLDAVMKLTVDEKDPSLPQRELDERSITPD
jgi:hypothetical protein